MRIAYKNKNTNSMEIMGLSGLTPSIGANGNWIIGDIDTGIPASSNISFDDWQSSTQYEIDDYVVYDSILYKCILAHTSTTDFTNDIANWKVVVGTDAISFDDWASATDYVIGDYVVADGRLYECNTDHTSGTDFDISEKANWDMVIGTANADTVDGKHIVEITQSDYEDMITAGTEEDDTIYIIQDATSGNVQRSFLSAEGYGGLRFYNGVHQYYDESTGTWVDISINSGNTYILQMTPHAMQSFIGVCDVDTNTIKLKWREPENTVIDNQLACYVEGVKIVRKEGSEPTSESDGTLIIDIKHKDFGRYANQWFVDDDSSLLLNHTYYYRAFPYSDFGLVSYSSTNCVKVVLKDYELYGMIFDSNESDPTANITYIEDNEGFEPVGMDYTNSLFNYGSWDNAWFIKNCKPCMLKYDGTVDYYLNPNDYSFREDGTASDITNTSYAGNVMVEFPLIYYKIVDNGDNTYSFYFSNKQIDATYKPWWSFYDANGNVIDHMYMAAYNGSNISSVLRSISGTTNIYSQTGTTEISYADANNTAGSVSNIWDTGLYSDRQLLTVLLMLIGKSTNTQTVFGNGNIYYESGQSGDANQVSYNVLKSGTMNQKGLFWGSNSTTAHIGVKVFGIENYWGNQWQRIRGWINNNGVQKIKLTYGQIDGSTADGYNTDGTGYISIAGATPTGTSGGYISKCIIGEYGIIPYQISGSASTYEADGLWYNNSQVDYAYVGGGCANSLFCGAFTVALTDAVSVADWYIGVSISCKPLKS